MITVNIEAIREAAAYRPAGYVEDVLAAGTVDGDFVHIPSDAFDALTIKYAGFLRPCGPGCQLKRLLAAFGFHSLPGCKCEARAAIMDAWGPDECEKPEVVTEILGWLREEAEARGKPFADLVGRMLIQRAVANARRHVAKMAKQNPPS